MLNSIIKRSLLTISATYLLVSCTSNDYEAYCNCIEDFLPKAKEELRHVKSNDFFQLTNSRVKLSQECNQLMNKLMTDRITWKQQALANGLNEKEVEEFIMNKLECPFYAEFNAFLNELEVAVQGKVE